MRQTKLNAIQQEKLLNILKLYKSGTWIYPGVLARKTKISIKETYKLLNELEEADIVSSYFEIICSKCSKTIGNVYKGINDIPEEVDCENCGDVISGLDNAFLIYKVN